VPLGGLVTRRADAYRGRSASVHSSVMDVHGGGWEEGSLPSPPEHMPRALAGSPLDGRGLLGRVGEWQQATLLHDICETQEQGLISKTRDQLPVYERYEMRGPGPGQKR
jgi:hypothetical protein